MKKRLFTLACLMLLLASLAFPAHAWQNLEPDRACSLTFLMDYDGKELNSGTLTIYSVANVYADNGWHFALIPELSASGISLDDLSATNLPQDLWTAVQEANLAGIVCDIRHGKVSFSDLPCGLYLVTQTEQQASTEFEPILPFLISLPQQMYNGYVYDVTAAPKVGLEPAPTTPPPTEPGGNLPQTGQLNWPVPIMAAVGVVLFALGWYLFFGKKEGYET